MDICPRCKEETNDIRKCNICGTEFCWKCLEVPTVKNPASDTPSFKSYCPECKSIDII